MSSEISGAHDQTELRQAVASTVDRISAVMASHAGGLELVQLLDEGRVVVRFNGMCTGCPLRSVTMASLIRPALGKIPGVAEVQAPGIRISEEAGERLAHYLAVHGSRLLIDSLDPE